MTYPRSWHIHGRSGSKTQDSRFPAWCLCLTEYEIVTDPGKNKYLSLTRKAQAGMRVDGSRGSERALELREPGNYLLGWTELMPAL